MENIKNQLGNNLYKAIVSVFVLLAIFLAAATIKEFATLHGGPRSMADQHTITVSGKGETVVIPDIATFTFGATEQGADVATAQKKVTDKMNTAIDYITKNGVAKNDVKTTDYNIIPEYDYSGGVCTGTICIPSKQVLRGYQVSQMVEVKIRDTSKAGAILSGIGGLQVTNVSGLSFSVDKPDEAEAASRKEAIDDAKAKADVLARELGVRIVGVVSFSESGSTPIYYAKAAMATDARGGVANESVAQVPAGENKITSNVSITYEIR